MNIDLRYAIIYRFQHDLSFNIQTARVENTKMKEAKKREEKQKELKEKEKRRKEQKEKERLKQNLILIHFNVLFVISSARVLVRYSRKNLITINIPTGKISSSTNKAKERVSWTISWTLLRPDKLIIGTTDDKNLDKLVSSSLNALCDLKYFQNILHWQYNYMEVLLSSVFRSSVNFKLCHCLQF